MELREALFKTYSNYWNLEYAVKKTNIFLKRLWKDHSAENISKIAYAMLDEDSEKLLFFNFIS
jgi:hypothetical protein